MPRLRSPLAFPPSVPGQSAVSNSLCARASPRQVDELIDEKGGTSSPLKSKPLASRTKTTSRKSRKSTAVDEKQNTHNQLALMDIDNLQLAVGQVRGCPWAEAVACTRKCHGLPAVDATPSRTLATQHSTQTNTRARAHAARRWRRSMTRYRASTMPCWLMPKNSHKTSFDGECMGRRGERRKLPGRCHTSPSPLTP